jgi:hypothetical protein
MWPPQYWKKPYNSNRAGRRPGPLPWRHQRLIPQWRLITDRISSDRLSCTARAAAGLQGTRTTKPGSRPPGICLLSRGAVPRGLGAAVRLVWLGNSLIVADQMNLLLWAELLALAPGARCQVGWSLLFGAPGTVR